MTNCYFCCSNTLAPQTNPIGKRQSAKEIININVIKSNSVLYPTL